MRLRCRRPILATIEERSIRTIGYVHRGRLIDEKYYPCGLIGNAHRYSINIFRICRCAFCCDISHRAVLDVVHDISAFDQIKIRCCILQIGQLSEMRCIVLGFRVVLTEIRTVRAISENAEGFFRGLERYINCVVRRSRRYV